MLEMPLAAQISNTMQQWDRGVERVRQLLGDADGSSANFSSTVNTDAMNRGRLSGVSVDGPGFLVLRAGTATEYARSADLRFSDNGLLVDQRGNVVLVMGEGADNRPRPLRFGRKGQTPETNAYDIENDGTVVALARTSKTHNAQTMERTALGRLCLAIFPVSGHLVRTPDGLFTAPPSAGRPRYVAAGSPNAGSVRHGAAEFDSAAVQQELHRLWMLSGRAALAIALAASADGFDRTALSLVK